MFVMADFGLFLRCEVLKKKIFRYKSPQLPFWCAESEYKLFYVLLYCGKFVFLRTFGIL